MKTRQVETVQGLAVCLGRDLRFAAALRYRVTVQRWLRQYRQGGLKKLLTVGKSKGRPKVIPDGAIKRLQQELCEPEGFDSYKEVQMWLEAVLGIKANYHVVHNLVRYQLKAKLKVPRTRSFEQEAHNPSEEAVKLLQKRSD
jgi:putative transposase